MYVELHCHSCFSLLDGASRPAELVERAGQLDMPALALTDHDALYGAVAFWQAARQAGIKPIFGAEVTLQQRAGSRTGQTHLTLLAQDRSGYANLSQLISKARLRRSKGEAEAAWDDLAAHSAGLIALSGCRQGEMARHLLDGAGQEARRAGQRLRELFGPERCYVEVQRQFRPGDDRLAQGLMALAGRLDLPVVATNNVHYATRAGHRLQDVLVSIRHLLTLEESHALRRGNSEACLKDGREMARLFADRPDALRNSLEIAGRCNLSLQRGVQDLPLYPAPGGLDGDEYLAQLCRQAARRHYGSEAGERVRALLAHELAVIARLDLANYFLIVWDIIRFAREAGIRCQGRGSAANSLVAFLLGITPIDPLAHDLVFERFLSPERAGLPDIDIDFQADRREEVIQYVYRRYGLEHAAMACTFVTFQSKSAIRDVGKALGFPEELLDLAAANAGRQADDAIAGALKERAPAASWQDGDEGKPAPGRQAWLLLGQLCDEIRGLPRHLGIHNGGFVLSGQPLAGIVPLEPASMAERFVVQWDKEALEDAGIIKFDLLGLRMLSALEEAVEIIAAHSGRRPDLDALSFADPAIYQMISQADTVGVFQVESRAQAQLLPRLKPRDFNDLIIEISLIRPGPVQAGMVHPYLRRRLGQDPVSYLHPSLEPALAETSGVIVFQEQVLKVAQALAGFSGGQGELLRRALGKKEGSGEMAQIRELFLQGAAGRGVSAAVAQAVFRQLEAFGGYSFAKSHAAAFAVIVYQSAWLKRYHPVPFYVALLNNQPMGFWSPAVLINDAKRHGIAVLAADVNHSGARYTVEDAPKPAIRIGLSSVKGLGEEGAGRVAAARGGGRFASLADFCRRTRLPRLLAERLILAGALDALLAGAGQDKTATRRRELLWQLGLLDYEEDTLLADDPAPAPRELPPLKPLEALAGELRILGVSAGEHVMSHYRQGLRERRVLSSRDLAACQGGQTVWVAGQVTVIQAPPTAKGFMFVTLEDEFGMINVIVAPDIAARYRSLWRRSPLLAVQGRVQREGAVVNLLALRPWRFVLERDEAA